ncbi:trigger factor [bacterium]|nr:trigger factor [bacterium]
MKVESEKLSDSKQLLKIEVPPEEVDRQFEAAYRELSKKARVDGFRRGKVPSHILKMHFSKLAQTEALKKIVDWSYPEAVKRSSITPIGDPDIEAGDTLPEERNAFSFKVRVETWPEVRVEGYKGLIVEKERIEISSEDVDRVLEMEREENADFFPIEGRPARWNDWVVVDFKSFLNKASFQNAEGYLFQLGSNALPKEVEEGLVGCQVGEEREIEVKEKVLYRVKLNGIKERRLVIMDDEFAKDLGNFSSLAELREDTRKRLEQRARDEEERRLKEKLTGILAEKTEMEVPSTLVERQLKYLMLASKLELDGEGSEVSQLREKLRPAALKQVKATLVLEGIAREEGIEATREEIEEEATAEPRSMTKGKKGTLSEDNRRVLAYRVRRRKTLNFLVSQARIKEKEKSLILTPDQVRMLRPQRKRLLEPGEGKIVIP